MSKSVKVFAAMPLFRLSKAEYFTLVAIAFMANPYTNMAIIRKKEREQIGEKTKLNERTISNSLSKLSAAGLLKKVTSGLYMVNPNVIVCNQDATKAEITKMRESF